MKLCARALLVLFPLVVIIPVVPASAQEADAADALFQKGKEEMKNKNYKAACAFFRGSYKLDPVPGALHALAVCHVEAGEVASAVMRFDEYLSIFETLPPAQQAKHAERAKSAREQRAALAPQVPEVTIVLPAQAPPGTRVFQDSVELSAASLRMALPIDPGEHLVTTQTPGRSLSEHRFTIQIGEKKRLELTIADQPQAPVQPATPPNVSRPAQGKAASNSGPRVVKEHPLVSVGAEGTGKRGGGAGVNGYQIGAVLAGGIGAVGLVGGIFAGALTISKKGIINEGCSGTFCTAEGFKAVESAQLPGAISTAGFVIGGAGLTTGTLLLLLATNKREPESQDRRRVGSIGMAIMSAGPLGWTTGVKGVW